MNKEKGMEKIFTLLCLLDKENDLNQRVIAKETGFSLGMVNTLIKTMQERELLKVEQSHKKTEYHLSDKGKTFLDRMIREKQLSKISILKKNNTHVKKAVILAAGEKKDFKDIPVDLLPIENEVSCLNRLIDLLHNQNIFDITIVIGYKKELYKQIYKDSGIQFIENDNYKWTGSMASLAMVKDVVHEDFLLLENDHIFEKRVLTELLEHENDTCLTVRSMCDDTNDCYVELDQNGNLFRLSKDIRQMNHIDGILTGIHKISYSFFQKMLDVYTENKNPLLNYEYVIETVARYFAVPILYMDDILCWNINNQEMYERIQHQYYKRILHREKNIDEEDLRRVFCSIMEMSKHDIHKISFAGGMTNANFKVITSKGNYILRMPGKCTEEMISRSSEKYNSKIGYLLDINVDTIYFNEAEGIKITKYIDQAETLSPQTARLEENMKQTSRLLKKLHTSHVELQSTFDVFRELLKYESLIQEAQGTYYTGYEAVRRDFFKFKDTIEKIGWDHLPCHNDLVAENFIKNKKRMYLIDWEYAGSNDPMWDIAAHLLECEFNENEEELFLKYYFEDSPCLEVHRQKILISKILQDVLWSAWTIAKEAQGEDFGTYGIERMNRARHMIEEYKNRYE